MPEGVVTSVPAPPESSLHRVPKAGLVDRIGFVLERARGRRVIHLGFVDETRMDERVRQGSWLHAQLARVAEEVVGIDIRAEGVRAAAAAGYTVHQADCEDAEASRRPTAAECALSTPTSTRWRRSQAAPVARGRTDPRRDAYGRPVNR